MQNESVQFSNISAAPAAFTLIGGLYHLVVTATWGGGSVGLSILAGDGSTYVPCIPNFTANGTLSFYLPNGEFELVITTATAVYATLTRVRSGD